MATFFVSLLLTMVTTAASFTNPALSSSFRPSIFRLFDSAVDTDTTTITVTKPEIHWTVPGFKVGWQDENGDWFDEDGKREGPPMNYWRQAADERAYAQDMELVDLLLSGDDDDEEALRSTLENLEKRSSVRFPGLSRKLLGRWAPLREGGATVAERRGNEIVGPCIVDVRRTDGQKLAPKIVYGTFQARLSEGESLTLERTGTGSRTMTVDKTDPRRTFPGWGGFGGATYLSDYILIMRRDDGDGDDGDDSDRDFWMRADDSHLPEESRNGGTEE